MGCTSSMPNKMYIVGKKKNKKRKLNIPEVVVFVPALSLPGETNLQRALRGLLPRHLVDRLSGLRSQIMILAEDTGGLAFNELQRALEEYLPVLIGLVNKEFSLDQIVDFKWKNLQDGRQEICIASSWFELISVVNMMAILSMSEANSLLIPKDGLDVAERTVSEDCKKDAIDLLIKASGYLDFCVQCILVQMPPDIKAKLPTNLQEEFLGAVSFQVLGQGTEMQLGLAVENQKATLSVKRRLACEQLKYFAQAHYFLSKCDMNNAQGKKQLLFLKWKYLEAKAAAYYYHGLILDKGKEPSCHITAVCCFLAADELLTDSKKANLSFCVASPVTRSPPVWGVMKHLYQKIPDVASKKSQTYGYLLAQEKALQVLPDLPDFSLSLRADDYILPEMDPAWNDEKWEAQVQTLKEHLNDSVDEQENDQ
ncbi:hypothetical protein Syun_024581 [Stephania yunnanensis]|uniref:BRO1 domain-containing protein n=1 Tax=Stephania yunnanensis TaxID=152371 RepID=A0AAP0I4S0_9MAGN